MPAEAAPRVEQEVVDRVSLQARRRQRVVELLLPVHPQHGLDVGFIAVRRLAHAYGQGAGLRIAFGRQLQFAVAQRLAEVGACAVVRVRLGAILDHRVDAVAGPQLVVPGLLRHVRRPLANHVEREQHALGRGFQRHDVGDRVAEIFDRRPVVGLGPGTGPGEAVELGHHRTAPVALQRRRHRSVEADAEGDGVVDRQLRNVPRRHLLGQARGGPLAGRHAPEVAGDPRKEHEQHQRDGQRLQQHGARGPERLQRLVVVPGPGHVQQRRRQQPGGRQHPCSGGQVLAVEEGRQAQEPADEHEHDVVAPRARLQQLQRRHQGQQGGPGIEAVQGLVADEDAGGGGEGYPAAKRAARQCPTASLGHQPPGADGQGRGGHPGLQVSDMRGHGGGQSAQRPGQPAHGVALPTHRRVPGGRTRPARPGNGAAGSRPVAARIRDRAGGVRRLRRDRGHRRSIA